MSTSGSPESATPLTASKSMLKRHLPSSPSANVNAFRTPNARRIASPASPALVQVAQRAMAELGDDARQLLALVALDHPRGDPAVLACDVVELAQQDGLPDAARPVEDHAAGMDPFAQPPQSDREGVQFVLTADQRGRP